jgi:hypothetical protein
VSKSGNVEIKNHARFCQEGYCRCLPPKISVDPPDPEYYCKPLPADTEPPILSEYLVHLFKNTSCITQDESDVFDQLPKRREALRIRGHEPGWGLYFEQGWDYGKIQSLYTLFVLVGSIVFAIAWAVLKRDVQTAFTIVACWVAAGASLLMFTMMSNSS